MNSKYNYNRPKLNEIRMRSFLIRYMTSLCGFEPVLQIKIPIRHAIHKKQRSWRWCSPRRTAPPFKLNLSIIARRPLSDKEPKTKKQSRNKAWSSQDLIDRRSSICPYRPDRTKQCPISYLIADRLAISQFRRSMTSRCICISNAYSFSG